MSVDTKDSSLVVIPRGPGLDSYLAYVAPKGKAFEGKHRLPGGRLKPGEDHAAALIRELREEYGIGLSDIVLRYTKGNVLGGTLYLCSAQRDGEPVQKEADVGAPQWLSASDLFASDLVPNCKIALCVYLLNERPASVKELRPLILTDEEFVASVQREAKDVYERLMM